LGDVPGDLRIAGRINADKEENTMLAYSREIISWEEYLQKNPFDEDIKNGISRRDVALDTAIAPMQWITNDIIATHEQATEAIQKASEPTKVGLIDLGACFDWGMGKVLWKFEIQEEQLTGILEPLQAPLDTQAKELRKRAEYAYIQGWYDEALKDFLESEVKNYQDFTVHQSIGNIYLYHQINLDKALESYLKGGRYAEPRSNYHAAYTYLHAGFVCYLQRKDNEAVRYTAQAVKLFPGLPEAQYNHAKFSAIASNAQAAIRSLETAILADRNYCLKANADQDLKSIQGEVQALFDQLRQSARSKAESALQSFDEEILSPPVTKFIRENIQSKGYSIKSMMNNTPSTYFGNLDYMAQLAQLKKEYTDYVQKIKEAITKAQKSCEVFREREKEYDRYSSDSRPGAYSFFEGVRTNVRGAASALKEFSEDFPLAIEAMLVLANCNRKLGEKKDSIKAMVSDARQKIQNHEYKGTLPVGLLDELNKLSAELEKICFIATATYGSPLAAEVLALKRFRDTVLSQFALGRWFVECYNHLSPPISCLIDRHDSLKKLARTFLVQPCVEIAKKFVHENY
jgi:hypothetical protein